MEALLQGIVQGLTEFLPVSSSGHLLLMEGLFHFRGDLPFVAFLHLGTFFAVLIFSFGRLIHVLRSPRIVLMLFVSTLPAALVGMFFEDHVERAFNPSFLPVTFSLTAALLGLSGGAVGRKRMDDMTVTDALLIGLSQALAVLPGISRSGFTIATAVLLGYEWEDSMYYSFILSLPVTLGAGVLEMGKVGSGAVPGFLSSFVFGLLALSIVRSALKSGNFYLFGYYLTAVAVVSHFVG